jgi:hypothetical protein
MRRPAIGPGPMSLRARRVHRWLPSPCRKWRKEDRSSIKVVARGNRV